MINFKKFQKSQSSQNTETLPSVRIFYNDTFNCYVGYHDEDLPIPAKYEFAFETLEDLDKIMGICGYKGTGHDFKIIKKGETVRIFIDNKEFQGVTDYQIIEKFSEPEKNNIITIDFVINSLEFEEEE